MKRSSRQNWLVIHLVCLALLGGLVVGLHADGGSQHQIRHDRAIPLGVSGGSNQDFDFPFCCGGTLGALVTKNSTQYILSNNHVIARSGRGTVGEPIVQPGLIDVGCDQSLDPTNRVATLSAWVPISFNSNNEVDAAIAAVEVNKVDPNGTIVDIGTISASTIDPAVGMTVRKSGRTTGHTTGSVSHVGVTVNITYPEKCGRGGGSTATFVNQFAVTDGTFSSGGDSGSLILENKEVNPSPVGLLFAGSSSHTIGNPIAAVRCALGVAMVGDGVSNTLDCSGGGGGDGGGGEEEEPPPAGNTASVGCVTYSTSGGPQSNRHLRITISIVDENGNPVSGASVSANITRNASPFDTPTSTTDSNGEVSFQYNNAPDGTYETTVTSISGTPLDPTATPPNSFDKGGGSTFEQACNGPSSGSLTRRGPPPEKTRRAIAVKQKYERLLFALSNAVVGVGVGAEGAEPAIDLFLESAASIPGLPAQIENVKVRTIVTGPFVAGGWREPSDLTGAVAACEQ